MDNKEKKTEGKQPASKVMSPREAAAKAVAAKTKTEQKQPVKIYEISKVYPIVCCAIMWVGFAIGLISWLPDFSILGMNNGMLGIPGGVMALGGVILMMATIKCPACGKKKLGRAMGARVPRSCECPECHAKINLK